MKREAAIGLTAFFAAALIGFLVETSSLNASSAVTRGDLLKIVSQVLSGLSPFLDLPPMAGQAPHGGTFADLPNGADESARMVLAARIMGGFPDGNFRPHLGVNRSEGFEIFGRAMEFVRAHLSRPQAILEKVPHFEDVGPDHWLQPILEKLAGIGFSFALYGRRLQPSEPFAPAEALAISGAMIEYFRNEMIIGEVNGASIRVFPKGTLFPIGLEGWKYAWVQDSELGFRTGAAQGTTWRPIPSQGMIPFNPGATAVAARLMLAHESFFPVELPAVSGDQPTILFQRLRRRVPFAAGADPIASGQPQEAGCRPGAREGILPDPFAGGQEKVQAHYLGGNQVTGIEPVMPMGAKQERLGKGETAELSGPQTADRTAWRTIPWREGRSTPRSEEPTTKHFQVGFVEAPEPIQNQAVPETPSTVEYPAPTPIDREFVYGTVVHSLTRKGISGATVLAGIRQVVTDADGRFVIPSVKEPILEMTIYCEGYETLSIRHRVGYKPGPLLLALKPLQAMLEGRVEDAESGQPIVGAAVSIGDLIVKTDAAGNFKATQLPFTYHQIGCQARGYMDFMELLLLETQETFKVLRLNRLSEKTLTGATIESSATP